MKDINLQPSKLKKNNVLNKKTAKYDFSIDININLII